jgi:acyl-CoA thioesterase FadM
VTAPQPFTVDALRALPARFSTVSHVRFQDVDAAGTIFYPRLFELFADVWGALLRHRGLDLPALLRQGRWAAPITHAEADYRKALRFGDPLRVCVVGARRGETSFRLGYRVERPDDPSWVYATGQTVHVAVDGASFRPMALPPELLFVLEGAYEPTP